MRESTLLRAARTRSSSEHTLLRKRRLKGTQHDQPLLLRRHFSFAGILSISISIFTIFVDLSSYLGRWTRVD